MFPLTGLHTIAAARGDGLRPEFLSLIGSIEPNTKVTDLARHRGDMLTQAGPNPTGAIGAAMPDGVVRFPQPGHKTISRSGALPAKRNI